MQTQLVCNELEECQHLLGCTGGQKTGLMSIFNLDPGGREGPIDTDSLT